MQGNILLNVSVDKNQAASEMKKLEKIQISNTELLKKSEDRVTLQLREQLRLEQRRNELIKQRIVLQTRLQNSELSFVQRMKTHAQKMGNTGQLGAVDAMLVGGMAANSMIQNGHSFSTPQDWVNYNYPGAKQWEYNGQGNKSTVAKTPRISAEERERIKAEKASQRKRNKIFGTAGRYAKYLALGLGYKAFDVADDVNEGSRELGLNSSTYQKYNYVGRLQGADTLGAFEQFRSSYTKAQRGSGEERQALSKYGVSMNQSPQQAFEGLGKAMDKSSNETQKLKDMITLFGSKANDASLSLKKLSDPKTNLYGLSDDTVNRLGYIKEKLLGIWDDIIFGIGTTIGYLMKKYQEMSQGAARMGSIIASANSRGVIQPFDTTPESKTDYADYVSRMTAARKAKQSAPEQFKEYQSNKPDLSNLQRMGSFVGGAPYASYSIRSVEWAIKEIEKNTAETAANLK